ncbi:MAG: radical SAM family heme chaperone HemW [Alphaproteobacteria bacterium]|nr:radical SAM family heme chaperone HemW [Alphaproteobacteria bacterium]
MIDAHNIYIHTPFCISKCKYCAFYSFASPTPDWDTFATGIINEIKYWAEHVEKIPVPTIFFGGGTPSLMPPKTLNSIINAIKTRFSITPNCEITMESNPGTLNAEKLSVFRSIGINRLSIGIQRLNDDQLIFLGRRHTVSDAMQLIDAANKLNLRVSGDFIYGIPNDTPSDIQKMCNEINTLGLQHVSMYELTIETGTPFYKMGLNMPSNTDMADMYNTISKTLSIPRYEVSNYACPGNECRHNLNIWDGAPYIGLGRGAAGRPFFNNQWYEQSGGMPPKITNLTINARATEKIITGLRTLNGVKMTTDVKNIINYDFINNNPDLLQITPDNRLRTTEKGMLILDNLLVNLI